MPGPQTGRKTLLAALAMCIANVANTAVSDANFTENVWFSNDSGAIPSFAGTGMAWAPDGSGRLFVIRKGGFSGMGTAEVRIIQNGAILPTPFATESVFTASECGLIGMAFDPAFATNGYVYFFATVSSSEQQIIRYTASGNTGTNRTVLVSGLPTRGLNHDGGGIGIGRDGKLYWAAGDLGNRTAVDLNTTSLAAKVGRANRDGSIPADNPFVDGPGGNNDYIFAGGVRNPFTMTFQPGTGDLWVNVVGDNYEQVFITNRGDNAGYDNAENGIPGGSPSPYARYITPVIKYRTNGSDTRNITASGVVRNGNVVTVTTTANHGFRTGERITLAGVTNTSFNGSFFLTGTPTSTTFTFAQTGPNATSGGGSASTLAIGGSITGGTFLDTSAVPAEYRGNFFFGDYNTGNLTRAVVSSSNTIVSVDSFATGATSLIDMSVGPDGALYGLRYNGTVLRWSFNQTGQKLMVTPLNQQTDEGATSVFSVRLASAPASNVTVTTGRTSGDSSLNVTSGSSLTFTPSNWSTPQNVVLSASEDSDATSDTATFSVQAPGLAEETVQLFALDNDTPEISVSTSSVTLNEGSQITLTVSLTGPPAVPAVLAVARISGDLDISVVSGNVLTFDSTNFATPQTVTLSAAEDADAIGDTAVVSISGSGFASRTVNVAVTDNEASPPVLSPVGNQVTVVNLPFSLEVNASGNPPPTFSLTSAPEGMEIDASSGVIHWTPGTLGLVEVGVLATNGTNPPASLTFQIQVNADQPPTASLTRPHDGEFVFGTDAEFFGDGLDDVGTVRAEFFIDGQLVYTDTTPGGHYHIGGSHNLWNTTLLSNGAHTVRMTVYDEAGQSGSVERRVIVANGIPRWEAWKLSAFPQEDLDDPLVVGDLQNPDGDSQNNLLEYAFGGDPLLPDQNAPVANLEPDGRLSVAFTRVLGATDLTYHVEGADSLSGPWSSAGISLISTESAGATERVIYKDSSTNSPRFLRLRIERQTN